MLIAVSVFPIAFELLNLRALCENDLSLRLLRELAVDLKHQQFHDIDCLLLTVDGRPLHPADDEPASG